MVKLTFPQVVTQKFISLIPGQRRKILELLSNGKIACFSLSESRSNAWLVVRAKNETEVETILESFPMYEYFDYEVEALVVHDAEFLGLPKVTLN